MHMWVVCPVTECLLSLRDYYWLIWFKFYLVAYRNVVWTSTWAVKVCSVIYQIWLICKMCHNTNRMKITKEREMWKWSAKMSYISANQSVIVHYRSRLRKLFVAGDHDSFFMLAKRNLITSCEAIKRYRCEILMKPFKWEY